MTFLGLPIHPLVVHAAVVLAPLAALLALTFTLVPRWRWAVRHPALGVAAVAAAAVQLSEMTGEALARNQGASAALQTHQMWAGRLQISAWALAALMLLAWWVVPYRSPIPGKDRSVLSFDGAAVVVTGSLALTAVVAVATLVLVGLTGHAGAEMVWAGSA